MTLFCGATSPGTLSTGISTVTRTSPGLSGAFTGMRTSLPTAFARVASSFATCSPLNSTRTGTFAPTKPAAFTITLMTRSFLIGTGDGSAETATMATSRAWASVLSLPTAKVWTGAVPRQRLASPSAAKLVPLSMPSPITRCPRMKRSGCHFSSVRFRYVP